MAVNCDWLAEGYNCGAVILVVYVVIIYDHIYVCCGHLHLSKNLINVVMSDRQTHTMTHIMFSFFNKVVSSSPV